jgi:hypothetical protein
MHPKIGVAGDNFEGHAFATDRNDLTNSLRGQALNAHFNPPTISLHRKLFSKQYYALARWPDGDVVRIAGFEDKSVAEYWIALEAEHWLQNRGLLKAA